jgi:hypothetical protein
VYAYKNGISVYTNIVQTEASDFIDDKVDDIKMIGSLLINGQNVGTAPTLVRAPFFARPLNVY